MDIFFELKKDSKAITKIQSIILVAIIFVASVSGAIVYYFCTGSVQEKETIKIGVITGLGGAVDDPDPVLKAVTLAAEQINAQGGILEKQVEVFAEDRGFGTDMTIVSNALLRLIGVHEVDFIIGALWGQSAALAQELLNEHKIIMMDVLAPEEQLTQKVLDDYDKYKYYFRVGYNTTTSNKGIPSSVVGLRQYTGFNKVGYLGADISAFHGMMEGLESFLPEEGFELVYKGKFMPGSDIDFTSYFAQAEAAGAEILITLVVGTAGLPIAKEWYDRQSPMVLWGINDYLSDPDAWATTGGKCICNSFFANALVAKYPVSAETFPFIDAYADRWGEEPPASLAYDSLRFLLFDAITRAGTTETEAVIKALEETSIATAGRKNFAFTNSHDVLVTKLWDAEDVRVLVLQYQDDGELITVYPTEIMEDAGATFKLPDWPGPWD